jgi:methionyl-tRNA formyltransferase
MRLVFAGSPAFAVPSLEALQRSGHEISGVVTQPDRPAGRGQKLTPPPVKISALAHDLPVYQPEKFNRRSFLDRLEALQPDVIAVVAYGKIFRSRSLSLPRLGCINLHASLLPRYRGVAPVNWAIVRGETTTGVTTMRMDRGVDTGDVILRRPVEIGPDETAGELLERLAEIGAGALVETCDLLARGEARFEKQDDSLATYAPRLSKEDGRVDWTRPAREVHNLVRGMTPWPGAVAALHGDPVKIIATGLGDGHGGPGRVIAVDSGRGILVSCGRGAIWLVRLQAQGKKAAAGADFARGYRIELGDSFESYTP